MSRVKDYIIDELGEEAFDSIDNLTGAEQYDERISR